MLTANPTSSFDPRQVLFCDCWAVVQNPIDYPASPWVARRWVLYTRGPQVFATGEYMLASTQRELLDRIPCSAVKLSPELLAEMGLDESQDGAVQTALVLPFRTPVRMLRLCEASA